MQVVDRCLTSALCADSFLEETSLYPVGDKQQIRPFVQSQKRDASAEKVREAIEAHEVDIADPTVDPRSEEEQIRDHYVGFLGEIVASNRQGGNAFVAHLKDLAFVHVEKWRLSS